MGLACAVVLGVSSQVYVVPPQPVAYQSYQAYSPYQSQLANCPCGPDWLVGPDRALIPQGWKGADFRAACAQHDACSGTGGCLNRLQCDLTFRRNLMDACQYSSNPAECRRIANLMYRGVRMYGGNGELTSWQKNYAVQRLRAVNAMFGRYIPPSGYSY